MKYLCFVWLTGCFLVSQALVQRTHASECSQDQPDYQRIEEMLLARQAHLKPRLAALEKYEIELQGAMDSQMVAEAAGAAALVVWVFFSSGPGMLPEIGASFIADYFFLTRFDDDTWIITPADTDSAGSCIATRRVAQATQKFEKRTKQVEEAIEKNSTLMEECVLASCRKNYIDVNLALTRKEAAIVNEEIEFVQTYCGVLGRNTETYDLQSGKTQVGKWVELPMSKEDYCSATSEIQTE